MMRKGRLAGALITIAIVGQLGAGCSKGATKLGTNDTSNRNNTTAATTPVAEAARFSACMRDNGVKDFPDPDASGQLTIDAVANGSSIDTTSAAFTQALSACKDLEPAGFSGKTRTTQQQVAALRFAQCIRDNGVKDFPDPLPDGPLIDTNRIPSTQTGAGMSILNAAQRSCRDAAFAAGVTGAP